MRPTKSIVLFTGSDFFRVSFLISKLNPHPFFAGGACVRPFTSSTKRRIIDDQERVFGTRAVVDLVAMKLEDLATACSEQLLITKI